MVKPHIKKPHLQVTKKQESEEGIVHLAFDQGSVLLCFTTELNSDLVKPMLVHNALAERSGCQNVEGCHFPMKSQILFVTLHESKKVPMQQGICIPLSTKTV